MVVIEECNELDVVDREIEEERRQKWKDDDYLDFRRAFDTIKREHSGVMADSDKLKTQGNNFFGLGLYEQAAIVYSDAIELQPENAVLLCNRSMAYLKQGLASLALKDAESSLGIDSTVTNIKAYWRKAQALLDLERAAECEAVADAGLELQPANAHINTVRRKARESTYMRRLCDCEWVGKLAQGVEKRMKFTKEGTMTMYVFGHPVESTFELSVEGNPRSMVVRMKPPPEAQRAGTGGPAPPMVYIFEFQPEDAELWLCHPVGTNEMPTKFEGPGFDKMKRAPPAKDIDQEGTLDERCAKHMKGMNALMPLIPPQLPEKPDDKDIAHEVKVAEKLSQMKRKAGLEVHERCVVLAKDPSQAANEELEKLACGLRNRFIARKIFADPEVEEKKKKAKEDETKKKNDTEAASVQQKLALKSEAAKPGCFAGIASQICKPAPKKV